MPRSLDDSALPGILLFLLLSAALSSPAPIQAQTPAIIKEIELRGLKRLAASDVLSRMKIRVGQVFDADELDREYQRLWKSREFTYIHSPEVSDVAGGKRIVITFAEKPRIEEIFLLGNRALRTDVIINRLRSKVGGLLHRYDLRRDQIDLERQYREKGYLFAKVKLSYDEELGVVAFEITEGRRVVVRNIEFKGNDTLEAKQLARVMETRTRSFIGIPNSGYFDEEAYRRDLGVLASYYRSHGFFDVHVSAEDFAFNLERTEIHVGIRVEEGPRYTVKSIEFEVNGPGYYSEALMRRTLTMEPGLYFDLEKVGTDIRALQKLYWDDAYIDARVEFDTVVPLDGDEVILHYKIQEGEKITIASVEIRGNTETKDKVIRRELTFYPGEFISFDKWERSRSNLERLNYFESPIRISPQPTPTPNQRDVVVDVTEKETGRLLFGFGISSGRGAAGNIAIDKRNFDIFDVPESFSDIPDAFTGAGQSLQLEAQPGTETARYRIGFREPRFMDSHTSLNLVGLRQTEFRDDYEEERTSGSVGIGQRIPGNHDIYGELSFQYEQVEIKDIEADAPPDAFAVRGRTRVSALRAELVYDRRFYRQLIGPISGFSTSLAYEYGGGFLGAELDYSKAVMNFSVHRTLKEQEDSLRHILTLRSSLGWIEKHHNTRVSDPASFPTVDEIPIYQRFFLGGARTVRGFRYRGLGPHVFNDAIGGNISHYANLEYTYPLVEDIIRGIFFVDVGNLAKNTNNFKWDEYRISAGGGVLLNIRMFGQYVPISLTWADAIQSERDDRERHFLFDIGIRF